MKYVIYAIHVMNVLVVAFVVGSMFGVWYGLNPHQLSYTMYLEQQQQLIHTLNVKLPLLGLAGILLTILSLWLVRGNRHAMLLLIVAVLLLIASGLITRFLNQPINAKVMTWTVENPPANWMELRDTWWVWHIVRMTTGILSLVFLVLGLLLHRGSAAQ